MRTVHKVDNKKTLVVHCNRKKGNKQRYVYTKTNMELVVQAFQKELDLLRKMCNHPPLQSRALPPPPPPPPLNRPRLMPPPPPPPATNWKGRSRKPIGPPKIDAEKPEGQIRRYKTYYNKYPSTLNQIPFLQMRKVDKFIPKGANGKPIAPFNNKFENVLKNAIRKYKNSTK